MNDPYKVLGIHPNSSKEEIKQAFRSLALKHHPDLHTSTLAKEKAEAQFREINNAYQTLVDSELFICNFSPDNRSDEF